MKKLTGIIILGIFVLCQAGCASEKINVDGKSYSVHKINQKPSTSY